MKQPIAASKSPESAVANSDGRRRRSERSRANIVEAMLSLVRAGNLIPSAEIVAETAGVGLRSVFRHFADMESLYREMSVRLEAELGAALLAPFQSTDWRAQLEELILRRHRLFASMAPFMQASEASRHRSPTLQADYAKLTATLRARIANIAAPAVANDTQVLEILDLVLSYESWQRLIRQQQLDPAAALAVTQRLVAAVLPA